MRDKFINKLAIVGLAAIFLLSMSSYSPAQKGSKKPDKGGKKPPELYKVTISINDIDAEDEVPGIESLDIIHLNGTIVGEGPVCGLLGYFYAEKVKKFGAGTDLLHIVSRGRDTLGLDDEQGPPLNMWVKTGKFGTIYLEECPFGDGCHGETPFAPGKIYIRFLSSQDGYGTNEDIRINWFLDVEPGRKKKKHTTDTKEFRLRTLTAGEWEGNDVINTIPMEETDLKKVGDIYETDVIGVFKLAHAGIACPGGEEGVNHIIYLPNFDIHITIERLR